MANLADIDMTGTAKSVIIYGPPKSGKTELAVKGLAPHFKVLYIDLEKGRVTLMKLPMDVKKKVEVIVVVDNKDNPRAASTAILLASGGKVRVCNKHGDTKCTECALAQRKPENKDVELFTEYCLNDLDPKEWVVIFDSFTQLTSSCNAHVTRGIDQEKDKVTYDHWRAQGVLLERFLDYIQNAAFNSVVITHEMGIEQPDKTEKLMPSGGTKNFARNVAKYFDHIVYTSLTGGKHKAVSCTTASRNALTGSRTDVEVDMNNPVTMCAFFGVEVSKSSKPATKKIGLLGRK